MHYRSSSLYLAAVLLLTACSDVADISSPQFRTPGLEAPSVVGRSDLQLPANIRTDLLRRDGTVVISTDAIPNILKESMARNEQFRPTRGSLLEGTWRATVKSARSRDLLTQAANLARLLDDNKKYHAAAELRSAFPNLASRYNAGTVTLFADGRDVARFQLTEAEVSAKRATPALDQPSGPFTIAFADCTEETCNQECYNDPGCGYQFTQADANAAEAEVAAMTAEMESLIAGVDLDFSDEPTDEGDIAYAQNCRAYRWALYVAVGYFLYETAKFGGYLYSGNIPGAVYQVPAVALALAGVNAARYGYDQCMAGNG